MNHIDRTTLMEHLALKLTVSLGELCDRLRDSLDLPEFELDYENETEWGRVEVENIEYNVSKPYEASTLQEWDTTVQKGCNIGISLVLYREHPNANDHAWAVEYLVSPVAQEIANEFDTTVHYHRTWFGPGDVIQRYEKYSPKKA